MRRFKQFILRKILLKNARKLNKTVVVNRQTVLEGKNAIGKYSSIKNTQIGFQSFLGDNCRIDNTIIGKYSCISHNVVVVQGTHPLSKFVSIHPCFYSKSFYNSYVSEGFFDEFKYINKERRIACIIGNDVWIGYGAMIMSGVTIGDGAVVGAGAIVTKDVEPYSIVAGVPAKELRKRFDANTIEKLLNIKWWNRDEQYIISKKDLFRNVHCFIDEMQKNK